MPEVIQITTSRDDFVLRQLSTEADDLDYFESVITSRRHLMRFCPETVEQYQRLSDAAAARERAIRSGKLRLGMWDHSQFAGTINLTPITDEVAEIGYWMDVRHIGRGLAATALESLIGFTREEGQYERLIANVDPENTGSQRVLEKNDFEIVRGDGFSSYKYILDL